MDKNTDNRPARLLADYRRLRSQGLTVRAARYNAYLNTYFGAHLVSIRRRYTFYWQDGYTVYLTKGSLRR